MPNNQLEVKIIVKLPYKIIKRRKWFLASCPVLDLHGQGENSQTALKNLTETLRLFFTSCYEKGTLDEVLKDCGLTPSLSKRRFSNKMKPPYQYIRVPLMLKSEKSQYSECLV